MTTVTLPERVASRRLPSVDVIRVLLTVLAAPFYLLGWAAGAVVVAVTWVCAAVAVGFDAGRGRGGDPS